MDKGKGTSLSVCQIKTYVFLKYNEFFIVVTSFLNHISLILIILYVLKNEFYCSNIIINIILL
jgi:hypothetical protein